MKISSVNNAISPNGSSNASFRGVADTLVNFWQFVDNGGRAVQFTAEDMCGTNLPRSIKGAMAGIQYTHEINVFAFLQEFVREFLTGPTMCITPWLIISLAKKANKSSNTHVENIKNLSYILGQFGPEERQGLKSVNAVQNTFFEKVSSDMLKKTIGNNDISQSDIDTIVNYMKKYTENTDKKQEKQIISDAQKSFESIIKKNKASYKDTNFLNAKYSINAEEVGTTSFKNYMEYATSYIGDYTKKYGAQVTDKNISEFMKKCKGCRVTVIAAMAVITAILMRQVPKLYTWVSGTVNPNAKAIYAEADKRNKEDSK